MVGGQCGHKGCVTGFGGWGVEPEDGKRGRTREIKSRQCIFHINNNNISALLLRAINHGEN